MHKEFLVAVENILDPLVGDGEEFPLSEVNGYSEKDMKKFPGINIDYEDPGTITRLDNDHNQRDLILTVRLFFPYAGGREALHARLDVVDAVLAEFDKRVNIDTLSGIMEIWEVLDIVRFDSDTPEIFTGYEFRIQGRQGVEFT